MAAASTPAIIRTILGGAALGLAALLVDGGMRPVCPFLPTCGRGLRGVAFPGMSALTEGNRPEVLPEEAARSGLLAESLEMALWRPELRDEGVSRGGGGGGRHGALCVHPGQ